MKIVLLLFTLLTYTIVFAQVGIGTTNPNESAQLDVFSSNSGVLIPRVALQSTTNNSNPIANPENSLLVYNTRTGDDVSPGYYYWSVDAWNKLLTEASIANQASMPKFFYMPSIAMPTHPNHIVPGDGFSMIGGYYSVSLYGKYLDQFGVPKAVNLGQTTILPVLLKGELDYYITSYDVAVFEEVSVSNEGNLTYRIIPNSQVTAATFMNIVFAVKP